MWKKDLRTLLLLLLTMLIWAVVYNMLTSCTKTTQELVTTHDTVFVAHSSVDSTNTHHGASDSLVTAKTDTVYKVRTDTVVKTVTKKDSVVVRDSVYVRERGDSVYIYKEKWRERLVFAHDTLYKSRTDTLWRISRDTVWQSKTDTVVVYRSMERQDSTYQSKTDKEKQIKERRTLGWLKVLGVFALVFGALGVWRWLRR
jgi:hypothetical protein